MYEPIVIPMKKIPLLATLRSIDDPSKLEPRHIKLLHDRARQRVGQINNLQTSDRTQMKKPRADLDALAIEKAEFEAYMKRLAPFIAARRDWRSERAGALPLADGPMESQTHKPSQKSPARTLEEQRLEGLRGTLASIEREIEALPNRNNGNGERFLALIAQKKSVERDIQKAEYDARLRSGSIHGIFGIEEKRAQIKKLDADIELLTQKICDLLEIKELKSRNWTSVDEQLLQSLKSMRAGAREKLKRIWDTAPRKIFSKFVDDGLKMDLTHGAVAVSEWTAHSFL